MTSALNRVHARAIGVATVLAAAGAARAQETAQLIVEVSQATLAPGESTEVRVLVAYAPRVGGQAVWGWSSPQVGTVVGFSLAVFDVETNSAIGVAGSWSSLAYAPWASVYSSPGTISGNNVLNAMVGTGFGPPFAHAVTENPLLLWTATWTAAPSSGFGNVNVIADVLQGSPSHPNTVHLWLQVGWFHFSVEDAWDCTDGQAVITVIPSPAAVFTFGLAALVAGSGRRRGPPGPGGAIRRTRSQG